MSKIAKNWPRNSLISMTVTSWPLCMWPEEFKHYSNFYTIPILIIFMSLPTNQAREEIRKKHCLELEFWGQDLKIVNPSNKANQELLVSNLRCQDKFEVRGQKTEAAWLRHLKSYEFVKELVTVRDNESIYDMLLPHSDFLKVETCT